MQTLKARPTESQDILENPYPAELTAIPQWVVWRLEDTGGTKPSKMPYQAHNPNVKASSTDPSHWATYEDAVAAYQNSPDNPLNGVGFVITKDDPYIGVDLDHCIDPATGALSEESEKIVNKLHSYSEISQSGAGLHIFIKGTLPTGRRKKGPVEMYEHGRYFTMSGIQLKGTPDAIQERQAEIEAIHSEVFGAPKAKESLNGNGTHSQSVRTASVDDHTLIEKAKSAKNGADFQRLWDGDTSGHSSHSEADQALCNHLAFWTGGDASRIDQLFRASGLYRDKWDESRGEHIYGEMTIDKALSSTSEYYAGQGEVAAQDTARKELVEEQPARLQDALLSYTSLLSLELPERNMLFPFMPEGSLIMAYGARGVGKTFFNIALTASLVTGEKLFRWEPPPPTGVLYIDGEMNLGELRERMTALLTSQPKAPLTFLTSHHVYHKLERDLVLTSSEVREEVTSILDDDPGLKVLILDNISCLFSGIDEDSKGHWEPIAAWLVRLRHRGITVMLVHHSGKGGQQRGTSGREDALDTVIQLRQPAGYSQDEGCHFELSFTKCRSAKGEELESLDIRLSEVDRKLSWDWKTLAVSKEEQARSLYDEGVTKTIELAEELGITKGYASKLLKRIKADANG